MSAVIDWKKQAGMSEEQDGLYPNAINITSAKNPSSERRVLTIGIPVTENTMLIILRAMTATKEAVNEE